MKKLVYIYEEIIIKGEKNVLKSYMCWSIDKCVMYMRVRGTDFSTFCDFSLGFWNCSISVVYNCVTMQISFSSINRMIGEMVSVFASCVVDRRFVQRSVHIKDYKICILCSPTDNTTLRSDNRDWLDGNQDAVSEWHDMSILEL